MPKLFVIWYCTMFGTNYHHNMLKSICFRRRTWDFCPFLAHRPPCRSFDASLALSLRPKTTQEKSRFREMFRISGGMCLKCSFNKSTDQNYENVSYPAFARSRGWSRVRWRRSSGWPCHPEVTGRRIPTRGTIYLCRSPRWCSPRPRWPTRIGS